MYENHRSHQNKYYNLGQREGRCIEGSLDFRIIFAFNLICAQLSLLLSLLFLCSISRHGHTQVSRLVVGGRVIQSAIRL